MNYELILKQYFGYDSFRGIQREIIESIGNGHDTLGLMPTGGGKSITFQVPALAKEGVCLVITPLIALMKDQVDHLRKRGIRADAVYSGRSHSEIIRVLENCVFGGVKILYISPERLSSPLFQAKLRHMRVSFITVDEAHCISQWGYDFRPSYLEISAIRKQYPDIPVLALTATATPAVVKDIQEKLSIDKEANGAGDTAEKRNFHVFSMSFERKNLAYVVREASDKETELLHILHSVKGSAIVYARSRKRVKEMAKLLNDHHVTATFYHAGLEIPVKEDRQNQWQRGDIRVMVATNAFGMGIDKPDVRLVIHMDCPDSIEAYFQEAGRAGRDEAKSYAVLLFNSGDIRKLHKRIDDNYPPKEYIQSVYEKLAAYYQMAVGDGYGVTREFEIDKFCFFFKLFPVPVNAALQLLDRSGYINYEVDPNNRARVRFLLERYELDRLEHLSKEEHDTIEALLRCYSGLFTDYAYIDEALIAQQTNLSQQQTYLHLRNLSMRHILDFIPKRKTPLITYTQRRVETELVSLPESVYEKRKEQYVQRIDAVISYATNDSVCRSRQLLRYFGEERSQDCQQCDVCRAHRSNPLAESNLAEAEKSILQMLSDGKPHPNTVLHELHLPSEILHEALQELVNEERIRVNGSFLSRK